MKCNLLSQATSAWATVQKAYNWKTIVLFRKILSEVLASLRITQIPLST